MSGDMHRLSPDPNTPRKVSFGEAFGVNGGAYNKAHGLQEMESRSECGHGIPATTSYDEDIHLAPFPDAKDDEAYADSPIPLNDHDHQVGRAL
jgi:hypothetical protein